MKPFTLKDFREATHDLPDDTPLWAEVEDGQACMPAKAAFLEKEMTINSHGLTKSVMVVVVDRNDEEDYTDGIKALIAKMDPQTFTMVERVLRLPFGTLKACPNDPALYALLNMIQHMPWLLQVADENFDPVYAHKMLLEQAGVLNALRPEDLGDKPGGA